MNQTISLQSDLYSFAGSIQTINESHSKAYHIKLNKDSLDEEIIEKQNFMIVKLKNQNALLKGCLSKAVAEIKELKKEQSKVSPFLPDILEFNEHIHNLESQNADLKKQLEQIQSEFARYKDISQQEKDSLLEEITKLKRQIQQNIQIYQTLHYQNSKKQHQINEKEKQLWELQSGIAQLTEENYRKQNMIDKFKIIQDEKVMREDFRYLGSQIQRRRKKSDDILIEGEEYLTSSEYEAIQKTDCAVQTQIYEVFQFSSRCVQRNTPSKRKNHHMSPEADKDQKIREYARQLTQKQRQCINQEKSIDLLKKDIKKLEEKVKEKQRQSRKYNKKFKKLSKKLNLGSKVELSDSQDEEIEQSSIKKDQSQSLLNKSVSRQSAEIQTEQTRIQNPRLNAQKKPPMQKGNNKSAISDSSITELSKKQKRRKNRTIQQDQQDGRQKLKSLIQDLEKKDSLVAKLESEGNRTRQILTQTRNKLRKKQNQCKKLSKDLRTLKSQISENNQNQELAQSSAIEQDSVRNERREAEIQTLDFHLNDEVHNEQGERLIKQNYQDIPKSEVRPSEDVSITEPQKKNLEEQEIERSSNDQGENSSQSGNQNLPNAQDLKILLPSHPSNNQIITHISPRSESYSHRQSGQRIINVEKIQKLNQYLTQENMTLKYELEELRRNWIEGLKNIQREYCSESGSDFHSQRDIIGAFSDREMIPRKIREKLEEDIEYGNFKCDEKAERLSIGVQTSDIQEQIDDNINQLQRKKSNRIVDDKSQKSHTRSDQNHHSHSKNQLQVSSETEECFNNVNELRPILDHEIKKKRIRHNLTVDQDKKRLMNKENHELKKEIKELEKALHEAKIAQQELLERLKQQELKIDVEYKQSQKFQQKKTGQIGSNSQTNEQKAKQQIHHQPLSLSVQQEAKTLQDAQIQTDDHEAVQISCIQRTPDKNIDLSLRNQNLFDLEQPLTCEQEIQTQEHELSIYRSFEMKPKEVQSMFNSSSREDQKFEVLQKHQQGFDLCQKVENRTGQVNVNFEKKITELNDKIASLTIDLQKQRAKTAEAQQQINPINVQISYEVNLVEQKIIQKATPLSHLQEIIEQRLQKQLQDIKVQTEQVQYSLSMINEQKHNDTFQKQKQQGHDAILQTSEPRKEGQFKVGHLQTSQEQDHDVPKQFLQSAINITHSIEGHRLEEYHLEVKKDQIQICSSHIQQKDSAHVSFQIKGTSSRMLEEEQIKTARGKAQNQANQEVMSEHYNDEHAHHDAQGSLVQVYTDKYSVMTKSYELPRIIKIHSQTELPEIETKIPTSQNKKQNQTPTKPQPNDQTSTELNLYKEQLLLTQQENFRLQKQIHQFTIKINKLSKEVDTLKGVLMKKDEQIVVKYNQLEQTKLLVGKLKAEHDRIILSLDRYVDDSSEGNTPGKARLVRDFDGSHHKKEACQNHVAMVDSPTHKDRKIQPISESSNIDEEQEKQPSENSSKNNDEKSKQPISLQDYEIYEQDENRMSANLSKYSQENRQMIAQSNQQFESAPPQLNYHRLSFSDRNAQMNPNNDLHHIPTQFNESDTFNERQEAETNKQSGFVKKALSQFSEQQALSVLPGSGHLQTHLLQSDISQIPSTRKQKDLLISDMMIQQTQSQILKCKQCLTYSIQIKRLEEHIMKLNEEIDQLAVEMKRKEDLETLTLKEKPSEENGHDLAFIQQIDVLHEDIADDKQNIGKGLDQGCQIVKTTQLVIKQSKKEEILASSLSQFQKAQEPTENFLTAQGIQSLFTIQNLQNLPMIYYDYQQDYVYPLEEEGRESNNLKTSRSSSIRNSRKPEIKFEDIAIQEAKLQLEKLYEPALVIDTKDGGDHGEPYKNFIERNQRQSQTQTIQKTSQDSQTHEQARQKQSQQSNEPNKTSLPTFPLLFVSQNETTYKQVNPLLEKDIFNPLFITSPSIPQQSIRKNLLLNELNELLLQNFLVNKEVQAKSQELVTQQLTLLGLKVFELIHQVRNSINTNSKIQLNKQPQTSEEAKQEDQDFLLDEEEDDSNRQKKKQQTQSHILGAVSKITKQDQIESGQLIKQIIESIGANFLYLQNKGLNISHEEYTNVAYQLQTNYLQLQDSKI